MPALSRTYPDVSGRGATYEGLILGMGKGPVGYWPLREVEGTTAIDLGSGGNNGTHGGSPSLGTVGIVPRVAGIHRSCTYNGNNNTTIAAGAITATTALTVVVWCKPADATYHDVLINKFNGSVGFGLVVSDLSGGNRLARFYWGKNSWFIEGTSTIEQNVWHHLAGVYDGSRKRIYVNGVDENDSAASNSASHSALPLLIAHTGAASGLSWSGAAAEVAVFAAALTAAQIYTLYQCGIKGQ